MQSWTGESPTFLIWAFEYTHRSGGVRALHRLCHLLNEAGYSARLLPHRADLPFATNSAWNTPLHSGPIGDSIVIYPEVVSGNPSLAGRVVRWALNFPGKLGGDASYAESEMVFVYEAKWLSTINRALNTELSSERILTIPIIDPTCIYPDSQTEKVIDCVFTHKGKDLRERFPRPDETELVSVEENTPSMEALGALLRRTRTLYSYDHGSIVVMEAIICGARVLVVDDDGRWIDPKLCGCVFCAALHRSFEVDYARQFDDLGVIDAFVRELRTRWPDVARHNAGLEAAIARLHDEIAAFQPRFARIEHAAGLEAAIARLHDEIAALQPRFARIEHAAGLEAAIARLHDEIAAFHPRFARIDRALDQQNVTAGQALAALEAEFRSAAVATAARFYALRVPVEAARADLDAIKNGVETWLLPTLARHEAALRRRGSWLRKLRRAAGLVRPAPSA